MKLLDGSLDGGAGDTGVYGARYGTHVAAEDSPLKGSTFTSSIEGVSVTFTTDASGKGGENAYWSEDGKALTINVVAGEGYDQAAINDLIKNANTQKAGAQAANAPEVSLNLGTGVFVGQEAEIEATVSGIRATGGEDGNLADFLVGDTTEKYADTIKFTSNAYGLDERQISIATDVAEGKENVTVEEPETDPDVKNGVYTLHLATGTEYTEGEIEKILAKAGLDYSIELSDAEGGEPDGDKKFYANQKVDPETVTVGLEGGQGVGKDKMESTGEGLTFQIGANGVEDQRLTVNISDMSSTALGVAGLDISTQDGANSAINKIDDAIKTVSSQRAKLGAVQNRLEHTVNSLSTAEENLQSAESQIRDTDMASEMIKYTKSNILQQASQSMLAQANQQPQGVLQLLG